MDEGAGGSVEVLVVLGEAPTAVDPGNGALHDPAPGQGLEALLARRAFDDLDFPRGGLHGSAQLFAAVGPVGEDRLQEAEEPARQEVQFHHPEAGNTHGSEVTRHSTDDRVVAEVTKGVRP